jgi:LacI family transcriptional regulator
MAQQAFKLVPRPTAILACNNFIAIGALRALREAGLRVPEDVSIVAFDDLTSDLVIEPFLTVADQSAYEMGWQATKLLIDRLMGPDHNGYQEIVLPTTITVRGSTGPVPLVEEPGESVVWR